ncbi:TraU family protein [Methylotuvimicrobium sp. KM1]|uniref:TraU family protein n=1 Tax=Methylotuvimicrobium sp. KM1 TaxID=3377707 RepID=UPI0038514F8D
MKATMRRLLWVVFLCANLVAAQTSAQQYECIQLRVVGACIWIVCTMFGCDIDVTLKVGHFNPDVLIKVTNPDGVDRVEDPKRIDTHNRNHQNLIFQSAWSAGHPLTGQIYCPSNTTAAEPYFWSKLDVPAWRWGGLDSFTLGAWVPGVHEIGNWPLNVWGHLYPRGGWTTQHSQPKSAAVVAQRVGDIITRDGESHVYDSIRGQAVFVEDQKLTWSPGALKENTNEEGWFQMMKPKLEQCIVFGENDTVSLRGWGGGRVADNGEYYFALWRPYTCCEIDDGALVVIDFMPFPTPVITH